MVAATAGDMAIIVHLKLIKGNQYRTCSSKQSMQSSEWRKGQIVCLCVDERVCQCVHTFVCVFFFFFYRLLMCVHVKLRLLLCPSRLET